MRGFLKPSVKSQVSDAQTGFAALSRGRRVKLAKSARTTLVKADQWARGDVVAPEIATALEQAAAAHLKKKK
jgi:hypothetical protein